MVPYKLFTLLKLEKKKDKYHANIYFFSDIDPIDGSRRYKIAYTNTFGKPPWFDFVAKEYAACRESVGLSDYSSFTKIDLWVGRIIFTQLF